MILLGAIPFLALPSCEKEKAKTPLVLFLGDSIAEAVAGPVPLTERESYGYYGIIGNINGYEYYNRGVSGSTTATFASYVMKKDDGVNLVKTLISTADVIHVSIIGNDLLNSYDYASLLWSAADGDFSAIREKKRVAKSNIARALDRIYELNPDVTVILQTLYNPANENSPLFSSYTRSGLATRGYTPADYHEILGSTIRIMNEAFYELSEERTVTTKNGKKKAPFRLIDVYDEIEKVYENDKERYDTLFCEDGIHPCNEGHAIIAELLQQELVDMGIAGKDTLEKYKAIRLAQLDRLYADKTDVEPVRAAINAAEDMRGVRVAYFDGTRDVVADAELTLNFEGEHFDETQEYRFTKVKVMGYDLLGAIDDEKSSLVFRADGSVEARMTINELTMSALKLAISTMTPMNLSVDYRLRLIDPYIHNLFPQADKRDILSILKGFEDGYGITFEGIDLESKSAKTLLATYRETGNVIIRDYDFIGSQLTIVYRGQYRLGRMTSRKNGETYTALYLNGGIDESESYVRFRYKEDRYGEKSVRLLIDVAEAVIEARSK